MNNIVEETNEEFHLTDDEDFDLFNSNYVPSASNVTANENDEHIDINHTDNNDDNVVSHIDIIMRQYRIISIQLMFLKLIQMLRQKTKNWILLLEIQRKILNIQERHNG